MTKSKTNALEALRALIAERQQYEQWITSLESKREGTPLHVFERVQADYNARLQRVIDDIKGHSDELQLSISTLSSRLVEVAREEDTKREALQEAELRAAVGEYDPQQWEQLKAESEQALEKIASDRGGLDNQLGELRSIQKLSEVGSTGSVVELDFTDAPMAEVSNAESATQISSDSSTGRTESSIAEPSPYSAESTPQAEGSSEAVESAHSRDQGHFPLEDAAAASAAVLSSPPPVPTPQPLSERDGLANNTSVGSPTSAGSTSRPRSGKTPPFGSLAAKPKQPESRTDQSKTLKCPECGTPNYPTEWYCERCGGELATV